MSEPAVSALTLWRAALGEQYVITAAAALKRASTATFATTAAVAAILQPSSLAEVQACLRIADSLAITMYPVSRGRNWGLGSRVPPRDAVLLDLSRMDRIVDYDPQLGYLVVEPGVTFQQAADFLREQASTFFLPVIGGSPQGSLIGNVAERGEAAGPYGQRLDFIANLQAVLADGSCVHGGFGRFPDASAKHIHRHGLGVDLGGLFAQSNLGVITQITIWLTPHPHVLRPFVGRIANRDKLSGAIDASRDLLLHRVVEANGIGLWNSHKLNATLGGYPWEAMNHHTPLDRERFPSEPWVIGGAIYAASDDIAAATGDLVQQRLRPFVDDWQWYEAGDANNGYVGVPSDQNVRSAYWRKKTGLPAELDPDGDRCGLIWLCFAVPFVGDTIIKVLDRIEPLIFGHGFEPNIGFNGVHGRCAHLFVSLIYDRDLAGEDARAAACHDQLVNEMQSQGHLPYRLGLLSMSSLPPVRDDYDECLRKIKQALDPNGILAPGRYD